MDQVTPSLLDKPTAFFVPFCKVDAKARMVYGFASTETVDSDGEIIKREAIADALPEYFQAPSLWEMHRPLVAGSAREAALGKHDGKDGLYIGAHVTDDQAWAKVEAGDYRGFSIGGKKLAKVGNEVTKIRLREISLVDRPANPDCTFDVVKADALAKAEKPAGYMAAPLAKIDETATAPATPAAQEATRVTSEQLTKNLFNVGEATEMLQHMVWMRDNVKRDEALTGEYAGMGEKLDAAVAFFSNLVKDLLDAAVAAVTADTMAEGDGMTKAQADEVKTVLATVVERFGKVKESIDALIAKREAAAKVEKVADAPATTPAPVAAPAAAAPAAPAAPAAAAAPETEADPLAKVGEALGSTLKAVEAIQAQVGSLATIVADMGKRAAPPKTVGTGGDPTLVMKAADAIVEVATRAEALAKRAEEAKDPGALIRLAQKHLI